MAKIMMRDLKNIFNEYLKAEAICDKAEEAYEADCENEAIEAEFDRTYKESWGLLEKLTDGIVEITGGRIKKRTARMMVISQRERLENLFSRVAD